MSVRTVAAIGEIVANAHAIHHFVDLVWLEMIGCAVRQASVDAVSAEFAGRYGWLWSWTRNRVIGGDRRLAGYLHVLEVRVL